MNAETARIADQLRRAFAGDAWHGPPLKELLDGVTAGQAIARPLATAHTIWELTLHIDVYVDAAAEAVHQGTPMPKLYGTERDWPEVVDRSAEAWNGTREHLFRNAERLAAATEQFSDSRLRDTVPGRDYDFYYMLHGIVQHSLYHGGQIAMLKRAAQG
jgi:hypothetical protein